MRAGRAGAVVVGGAALGAAVATAAMVVGGTVGRGAAVAEGSGLRAVAAVSTACAGGVWVSVSSAVTDSAASAPHTYVNRRAAGASCTVSYRPEFREKYLSHPLSRSLLVLYSGRQRQSVSNLEEDSQMLMRSDPFGDLDRLTAQLFKGARTSVMPLDAYRQEDHFVIHFDLPGVESDSIDLTVEKNVLTVTATRSWGRDDNVQVVASERPQGTFSRQLFLGDSLDAERIEASYTNGVLTVRLPVADKAKPRKVAITHGDGESETKSIETTSAAA
jgi:HSP20 family protein